MGWPNCVRRPSFHQTVLVVKSQSQTASCVARPKNARRSSLCRTSSRSWPRRSADLLFLLFERLAGGARSRRIRSSGARRIEVEGRSAIRQAGVRDEYRLTAAWLARKTRRFRRTIASLCGVRSRDRAPDRAEEIVEAKRLVEKAGDIRARRQAVGMRVAAREDHAHVARRFASAPRGLPCRSCAASSGRGR